MNFQKIKISFIFSILIVVFLASLSFIKAELDCLNTDITKVSAGDASICADQLKSLIEKYLPAQEKNKKDLAGLRSQLNNINQRITALSKQLDILAASILKREEDVAYTKKIFEEKTNNYYKSLRMYEPSLLIFLSSSDVSDAFRQNILRQYATEGDRTTIDNLAKELTRLKEDKSELEKNKASLAVIQKQVADRTNFLAAEVAKVEAYLATLSAKQQAFIAAKLESLGISRSAYNLKGGCSSDINPFKSPGFSSPAFGFFSFGVPNRVGMNQYGAWGRAKGHQNYDQILRAYYNFDNYQDFSSVTIRVNNGDGINQGNIIWSGSLEDYVKRIYEVPDSWTENDLAALKAQAIAARSYVLAATSNGANSICANEYCQVFKTDPKGGNWEAAVIATTGKVMIQGGQPIKAWFSAVHGGYAFNSGDIGWNSTSWTKRMVDTSSGNAGSFSDLLSNAYDRDAQWFYCDWGGRSAYNGTGWLKSEEVADIVNVVLLAERDGSTKEYLYQMDIDKGYQQRHQIPDPWDPGKIKTELSNRGITPFNSVSDISIGADFGTGRTTSVTINGDAGSKPINGDDFKNYFNQRAPSNIQIVGPLYNVEKK